MHIHVQVRLGPTVNDMQLTDLVPNTEYAVTVQAVLHDLTSEPVTVREVTCKLLLSFISLLIAVSVMFIRIYFM